jgi:hypothetical protein
MALQKYLFIPDNELDKLVNDAEDVLWMLNGQRSYPSDTEVQTIVTTLRIVANNRRVLRVVNEFEHQFALEAQDGAILVPKEWCKPIKKNSQGFV